MHVRFVVLVCILAVMLFVTAAQEEAAKGSVLARLLAETVVKLRNMKRWLHDELHHTLEVQPGDGRWAVIVKLLADKDRDGRLSLKELSAFLAKIDEHVSPESLAQHDLDGDGFLDDREVVKAMKALYL